MYIFIGHWGMGQANDHQVWAGGILSNMASSLTPEIQDPQKSPYLRGNYAPVHEEIAADDLLVIGEVPRDLAGTFVRNSSNPRFPPRGRYHWFDGDGMIHAVHFADGRAGYRNRWVRTRAFQ